MPEEATYQLFGIGGLANRVVGPAIASAATIAPTFFITPITGTVSITTITLPHPGFSGVLIFLPAAAAVFATGGNIQAGVTCTANVPALAVYSPADGKWFVKG